MTPFEFDQLMVLAGSFEITGEDKPEDVRHAYRRCAEELREFVRHCATSPDVGGGEPTELPPMPSPRVPIIPEET